MSPSYSQQRLITKSRNQELLKERSVVVQEYTPKLKHNILIKNIKEKVVGTDINKGMYDTQRNSNEDINATIEHSQD